MLTLLGKPEILKSSFHTYLLSVGNYFFKLNKYDEYSWLIDLYYDRAGYWGIRPDVLISQSFLETGRFTSKNFLPPIRNMAGIGVNGNPTDIVTSNSYSEAVEKHYAHMAAYVYLEDKNNASKIDPRYKGVHDKIISGSWKKAEVITDLNGKWATDSRYGGKIEIIYNLVKSV